MTEEQKEEEDFNNFLGFERSRKNSSNRKPIDFFRRKRAQEENNTTETSSDPRKKHKLAGNINAYEKSFDEILKAASVHESEFATLHKNNRETAIQ